MIENVGERLSWISVLIARHDDDDDDDDDDDVFIFLNYLNEPILSPLPILFGISGVEGSISN